MDMIEKRAATLPISAADDFSADCIACMSEYKADISRCFAKMDGASNKLDLEMRALESMVVQLRKQQLANVSLVLSLANRACTTIQCFWRAYQWHWTRIRNACVLTMQAHGRRFLGQRKCIQMQAIKRNQVEQASAKCVQNVARSRISHKVVAKRRKAACKIGKFGQKSARRAQQRREVSAVRIQAVCRKKVARQNVHNARQKRKEECDLLDKIERLKEQEKQEKLRKAEEDKHDQLEKIEKTKREEKLRKAELQKINTLKKREENLQKAEEVRELRAPLNAKDLQKMDDDEIEMLCSTTSGRQQLKHAIRSIKSPTPSIRLDKTPPLCTRRRHTDVELLTKPGAAALPPWSFSSVKKPATPSSQAVEKNAGHHRPSYKSPKLEARKSFVANFQSTTPLKKVPSLKLPNQESGSRANQAVAKVALPAVLAKPSSKKPSARRVSKIDDDNHSIRKISTQLDALFSNFGDESIKSTKSPSPLSLPASAENAPPPTNSSVAAVTIEDSYDDDFDDDYGEDDFEED